MEKLIAWVEIPALDFKRAVNFYSNVLQTELAISDCGEEKMACFQTGEGAVSYAPGFKPSENGVMLSFHTGKNLDAAMERVIDNGGRIIQTKTKIEVEGRGYFAVFMDCEGNKLGVYGDE